jgi:PKD repeat protein
MNKKIKKGGFMKHSKIHSNLVLILLAIFVFGSLQLNAGQPLNAGNSKEIPITIFASAYKHIPGLENSEKEILKLVRKEFQVYLESKLNYRRVVVDAIDENNDADVDSLFVYFLMQATYDGEVSKVTLGKDFEVLYVEHDYKIKKGDTSAEMTMTESCNCPDTTVEVLLSTCETGIPTAVSAINTVYNTAVAAGYNTVKLLGSDESISNIQNWLCCPNLKYWGRVGHGLTNLIVLSDGNLTSSYFDGLGANSLPGKVFYWNSCQVFNNPMKTSVLNTGAGKFIGGICNLYIGSSEEVFKCWNTKNLYQDPAPQTDEMCYWSSSCESSTGYPEPGCHGCGGPDNTFPAPGSATTYNLTVNTVGQGTVSLSPSGGTYTAGTVVTLSPIPSAGWQFSSWSGDLTGSTNPGSITMDADKTVTATFIQTTSPPVADFTASSTSIQAGQSVTFTDTSTNGPTSWSWSFPGGTPSTSTAQNPTVTYNTVGVYSVTLTATNAFGSDNEVKTNHITVTEVVIAPCGASGNSQQYEWIAGVSVADLNNTSGASGYSDFTSMTAHVTAGQSVNVTLTPGFASSSYNEYWKIWVDYNRDGDFEDSGEEVFSGNGTSSVSGSFTVPSSASGTTRMRVAMRYNNAPPSCGSFDFGEVEDYSINVQQSSVVAPVANFTASATTIDAGQSVTFTDTSTNNPTSWSWSFPGGTPSSSTAQNPTVTYNTAGTYSVTLTATNSAGSDVEVKTNYIIANAVTVTYCTSSGSNQNYEWIAGVALSNINNSSSASGYTDFTNLVANLTKGASVSFTLTPGFASSSYTEYWKIWIDLNKDGDFSDSGEEVFSGSGSSVVTGSFTVPTSAITGNTRMRVTMQYNSAPSSCGSFTYGEVEDYTVNLQ